MTNIQDLITKLEVTIKDGNTPEMVDVVCLISNVKVMLEQEAETHKVAMIFDNGKCKEVYSNKKTCLVLLNQKENKTVVKELPVCINNFIVEDAFTVVNSIHILKTQIEEKF